MKIQYRRIWFNPLYFIIMELISRGVNEFYIYGGKSSSKTITIGQVIAQLCLENNENAICFRKVGGTIKTTLKASMKLSIKTSRLENGYQTMDFSFKSRYNHANIVLKGLDDENKAKGIEGFSYLYHDELDQFNHEDYKESINAFRGEIAKCYFGAWNPTDIESFVKTKIIDTETWIDSDLKLPSSNSFVKISKEGNKALIKTLYTDNYWTVGSPCGTYGFLDQNTITKYENYATFDDHWYRVNVLGEWGVIKPTDPFFKNFNEKQHIRKGLEVNENLPMILSFDFNVIYSCIAAQFSIYDSYYRVLKDWYEDGLDLDDLCGEIINHFGVDRRYIITGDATGKRKSIGADNNASCYETIYKSFKSRGVYLDQDDDFVLPGVNMSHQDSRLRNNIIHKKETDYFYDQVNCSRTIADMYRLRTTRDGGLNKEDAKKHNYGHLADCARYLNDVMLYELFQSYDFIPKSEE